MSTVKSYRLNNESLSSLKKMSEKLQKSEKEIIQEAIDAYHTKMIKDFYGADTITCDFKHNMEGINNPNVTEFIQDIELYTKWRVKIYWDDDSVHFYYKE